MTVIPFVPRVSDGRHFVCAICDVQTWTAISLDHFAVCAMCRWFCNAEGRWGRRHDGIGDG